MDFSLPTNKGTTIDGKITISLNGNKGFKYDAFIPLIWQLIH